MATGMKSSGQGSGKTSAQKLAYEKQKLERKYPKKKIVITKKQKASKKPKESKQKKDLSVKLNQKEKDKLDHVSKRLLMRNKDGSYKLSDKQFAKQVLDKVNTNLDKQRQAGSITGGVQHITGNGKTVVVGDLHNQITNLVASVKGAQLDKFPNNKVILIGDILSVAKVPNPSNKAEQANADQTADMLRVVSYLKARYPEQVLSVSGNHEMNMASGLIGHTGAKQAAPSSRAMMDLGAMGMMMQNDAKVDSVGLLGIKGTGKIGKGFSVGEDVMKSLNSNIAMTPLAIVMDIPGTNQKMTFQHAPTATHTLAQLRALPEAKLSDLQKGDYSALKAKIDTGEYYEGATASKAKSPIISERNIRRKINKANEGALTVTGHFAPILNARSNVAKYAGLTEATADGSTKIKDAKGKLLGISVDSQTSKSSVFVIDGRSGKLDVKRVTNETLIKTYIEKKTSTGRTKKSSAMAEYGRKVNKDGTIG